MVVVAATVVLAVAITALGVRGAGPARRATSSAVVIVIAAAGNLHEGEGLVCAASNEKVPGISHAGLPGDRREPPPATKYERTR